MGWYECFTKLFWWQQPAGILCLEIGPVVEKPDNFTMLGCCHHCHRRSAEMALILTDEQQATLRLNPKTKKGNPAQVDGPPTWSSSDPSVVNVSPDPTDPTGLTATAVATGKLGAAQVQCVADADLGAGVRELTAVLDVVVKAAEAVSLDIEAGAPTEAPSTPPTTTTPPPGP